MQDMSASPLVPRSPYLEEEVNNKQWPANEIVMVHAAELEAFANNPRTHSDYQVKQIMDSMREWGWTMPVLIDEKGMVITGHGRVMAALGLEITTIPCLVAKGWTEAQKRAYVIADNKLTLNGSWDWGKLGFEMSELKEEMGADALKVIGFSDDELEQILGGGQGGDPDPPGPGDGQGDAAKGKLVVLYDEKDRDVVREAVMVAVDELAMEGVSVE